MNSKIIKSFYLVSQSKRHRFDHVIIWSTWFIICDWNTLTKSTSKCSFDCILAKLTTLIVELFQSLISKKWFLGHVDGMKHLWPLRIIYIEFAVQPQEFPVFCSLKGWSTKNNIWIYSNLRCLSIRFERTGVLICQINTMSNAVVRFIFLLLFWNRFIYWRVWKSK